MLISSIQKMQGPLTRQKAVTCALINQLAAPGLGSVIGGRKVAGAIQLLFSLTGFVMVMFWFVWLMYSYYSLMSSLTDSSPEKTFSGHWVGLVGLILFVVSWVWSLFTSFSLISSTKPKPPGPPPLNDRT